jgi:Predicted lipase
MPTLNPDQSAKLANDVYTLTRLKTLEDAYKYLNTEYAGVFSFSEKTLTTGKTGGPGIIKCKTAFGFTLLGQGSYSGQAFIIFRGTQYLADWLTNLNIGCSRSSFSQSVHDGFNIAFKSMERQIASFMDTVKNSSIHSIHCVGHSLGGALATLCGEWIKAKYGIKPYIYTFGSPRVGMSGFATTCTREIGGERIFRAYHKTDVVPCIPIWPFIHTPNKGTQYYLPSPGILPGAEYHSMIHYMNSVSEKSWKALSAIKPEEKSDFSIAAWLKEEGPVGVTIKAVEWLDAAIQFVIRKCIGAAEWIVSKAMGTSATIMDRLAFILSDGVTLEENISAWVVRLIRKILSFLGRARNALSKAELNRTYIKSVLTDLQVRLNGIAQNALSSALVQGRTI